MENYMKAVLYAYPLLKTVEEDYAEHIKNKAVLSYNSRLTTEELAEYLAGEILHKNRLAWLKSVVEETLAHLSEAERALLAIRYFGKDRKQQLRGLCKEKDATIARWSERKYFRLQKKLGEKIGGMLQVAGVTKRLFDSELAEIDLIGRIYRYIEKKEAAARERGAADKLHSSVS